MDRWHLSNRRQLDTGVDHDEIVAMDLKSIFAGLQLDRFREKMDRNE